MSQLKSLEQQLQAVPPSEKPAILVKLAILLRRSNPEKARKYAEQAIAEAKNKKSLSKENAIAHRTIGYTYYVQGNQTAALKWAEQAIQLMEAGNFIDELVGAISNLAIIYIEIGDYPRALNIFMQGIEKGEEIGDEAGIASINYNIGYLYKSMRELDKAIAYTKKALLYWEPLNHEGTPYAYNSLSEVYLELEDAENGRAYAEKSLQLTQTSGDQYNKALAFKHLGESWRQQGKFEEALVFFLQGIEIEEKLQSNLTLVFHYIAIGNLYIQMQQFGSAAAYLHKALDAAKSLHELPVIMDCYEALTTLYETQGEFAQALDYFRKYTAVKDELFNEKKHKQLTELQTKFDTERKEKEAEIYQLKTVALEKEIAQRRQAEAEALRQSEYYQALLQNIPIAAMTFDLEGRVDSCNTAFETIFGFREKDILGKRPEAFFASEYAQEVTKNITQTLTSKPLRMITRRPHADGTLIDVQMFAVPVIVAGEQTGVLVMYHDIRERIATETALRDAKQAAEQANHAKSVFLANMSHELRTPLNSILGYAQILQQPGVDYTTGLNVIEQSGQHLLTLINNILDLAKVEAGKVDLNPAPVHLTSFLDQITAIVRERAGAKSLLLTCERHPSLPAVVLADETRLRQVLLNLLNNAVKFTDRGHVTLTVSGSQRSGGVSEVQDEMVALHFSVEDTGPGIAPEHLERIFRPFEQVSEINNHAEGTGLGLAISRQIVTLMGGQLQVQSELEQGSTFWFEVTLPVIIDAEVEQPSLTRHIVGYEGSKRSVLVADDVLFNRLLLRSMLEPLGFEVSMANDGQQAVDQALALRPDTIVMDNVMPVKTGFEAIQEIRQQPELADVFIIAASASVLEADRERSQMAGCDVFIPKPIDREHLLELLATHLNLTWICAEPEAEETWGAIIPPPPEELKTLSNLVKLGRILDIQQYALSLQEIDEAYVPFARKLLDYAGNFDIKLIETFIRQFIEEKGDNSG